MNKEFINKMKNILGEEFESFIHSYEEKPLKGLRINPLKVNTEEFLKISPFALEQIPWCSTGFYYDEKDAPGKHPFHEAGLYYIQEPSAMAVAEFIKPKDSERILDLCAAPGGKTTQIAGKMNKRGILVSNEINYSRAKILAQNVERMGIENCAITSERPDKLEKNFMGYFDKILVDAPCSGEGMFRKDSETIEEWSLDNVCMCADRQLKILSSADKMLKPQGTIVYSTCTFSPEENEGVIEKFITEYNYEILSIENIYFDKGKPEWINSDNIELRNTVRLWPHKVQGEGHYIAVLKKKSDFHDSKKPDLKKVKYEKPPKEFMEFCMDNLNISENNVIQFEDRIYKPIDEDFFKMKGIQFIKRGFLLGTVKKNRFEPSHGWSHALKKEDVKRCLDFPLDSQEIRKYLKGESFYVDAEDGWALITVNGFSLGWAKVVDGILKNHYPKGLRTKN